MVIVLGILMLAYLDCTMTPEIYVAFLMESSLWKAESAVAADPNMFLPHSAGDAEPGPKALPMNLSPISWPLHRPTERNSQR